MMPTPKLKAKEWVGKRVSIRKRDGSAVHGKLVAVRGNQLMIQPEGKSVKTKALLPLLLYDVAALGAYGAYAPYGYGGYGYGGIAPYGYGYGYPYFF